VAAPVVAVAMSGGVDSSVAAALCVAAGHQVVGIMLRLWAEPGATAANKCCTRGAIEDARAVAAILDIPFSVLDMADLFKQTVVDGFLAATRAGDTPNPCFTCNRQVRFGHLLAQARALGADLLATGHYARIRAQPDGTLALLRGVDPSKDQSYVLHRLSQAQLAQARFPVGDLSKAEVRRLAEHFGLPVARRADSVDLCWVGEGGVRGFLERQLPPGAATPGPIVDPQGNPLGQHAGLAYYTLGQRRGLGLTAPEPCYVIGFDRAANTLVVGPAAALYVGAVRVRALHWVRGAAPAGSFRAGAQVRYRAPEAAATVTLRPDAAALVDFDQPQRAPTPGQGLVLYAGDEVLGGGLIAPPHGTPAAGAAA
jgi:tRNA-specific 2-thiouridylase